MLPLLKRFDAPFRLLLVVYCALIAVPLRWHQPSPDLDGSWAWALNALAVAGLKHGRDLLFTYGPWGYLSFPMPGPTLLAGLLAQTALWAAFVAVLAVTAFSRRRPLVGLLLFSVLLRGGLGCFHQFGYAGPDMFFALLALLMLGLSLDGRFARVWYLAALAAAAALFLVKLSSGILVLSAAVLLPVGLFVVERKSAVRLAVLLPAVPLLFTVLFLAHSASLSDLAAYLRLGLDVATGYSAAMSGGDNQAGLLPALWIALAYLLLCGVLWLRRERAAALATALLGPLLLTFKHAFVRPSGHIEIYFLFSPFLVATVVLFMDWNARRWWSGAAAVAVFALAWLPTEWRQYDSSGIEHARQLAVFTQLPQRAPLPCPLAPELQARLARQTFSIFPWDLVWAEPNLPRYRPFPVLQSYQAYSAALDAADAAFLRDPARAPELIVFSFKAIDGRHPLADVPATFVALYQNYRPAGRFGDQLLLERLRQPRFEAPRLLRRLEPGAGSTLHLAGHRHPLLVEVPLRLNAGGWLRQTFYRLDPLYLLFSGPGSLNVGARVPPAVLSAGMPLNFLPSGLEAFERLLAANEVSTLDSIDFYGPAAASLTPQAGAALYEIAGVTLQPAPIPVLPKAEATSEHIRVELLNEGDASRYGRAERIELPVDQPVLSLSGYAVDDRRMEPGAVVVVRIDGAAAPAEYGLPSPGIAAVSGRPAVSQCGFRFVVPLWRLAPGEHTLQVALATMDGQYTLSMPDALRVVVPGRR